MTNAIGSNSNPGVGICNFLNASEYNTTPSFRVSSVFIAHIDGTEVRERMFQFEQPRNHWAKSSCKRGPYSATAHPDSSSSFDGGAGDEIGLIDRGIAKSANCEIYFSSNTETFALLHARGVICVSDWWTNVDDQHSLRHFPESFSDYYRSCLVILLARAPPSRKRLENSESNNASSAIKEPFVLRIKVEINA